MSEIENESDIERLRARAIELYLERDAKGTEVAALRQELERLKEQLAARVKKQHGKSSERRTPPPEPEKPKKPQTGHGPTPQPALDEKVVDHALDAADQTCPACGGALDEIPGEFEESVEVDIEQARPFLRRHRRKKYACRCRACVETALGPPKLIVGGRYSVRFAAHVALQKYDAVVPLDRQCKLLGRLGLTVTSQALFDQLWAMACHLMPTYKAARERLVSTHAFLHMDETPWEMLAGEKAGRWYVWSMVAPDGVWYGFDESRSADAAARFLDGFQGHLMTDGYASYKAVAARWAAAGRTLVPVYCWSHVRRGFIEAERNCPEVKEVIQLIDRLFVVEREAAEATPEQRAERLAELRRDESAAVVERIKAWLDSRKTLPGTKLHGAVQYGLNHWAGLTVFVGETVVPLSNNAAERSLRDPVLGRKTHYGSRSERGTTVAALFYTLIESAQMCGVEPGAYLVAATERAIEAPGTVTLPQDWAAETKVATPQR